MKLKQTINKKFFEKARKIYGVESYGITDLELLETILDKTIEINKKLIFLLESEPIMIIEQIFDSEMLKFLIEMNERFKNLNISKSSTPKEIEKRFNMVLKELPNITKLDIEKAVEKYFDSISDPRFLKEFRYFLNKDGYSELVKWVNFNKEN